MNLIVRRPVAALTTAAALLLAACGSSSPSTSPGSTASVTGTKAKNTALTSVTVAYIPLSLFEPLFIAMHNGYFAKEGIDVHLTVVPSGQSATTLAATNKVQVVLGGFSAGMFNAIKQGLNFKVVGSMAEEAPGKAANGLVVEKSLAASGKVTNPGDLKGMKIAVNGGAGSAGAYLVALALRKYHLTLADVTLVNIPLPEQESALQSGAVAAAYMSTPFLSAAVNSGVGVLEAGAPVNTAVVGIIYGGAFARSAAAQPFFDALTKAAAQLQGAAAASATNLGIVAKATGATLASLQAEPANLFSPRLAPPVTTLQDMQQVFLAAHNLTYSSPVPASSYVDSTFSQKS